MSSAAATLSKSQILREFRRSKSALIGAGILLGLILMTIYSAVAVPLESYRQWNNPNFWIDLPKSAAPAWTNVGFGPKMPEHFILHAKDASISTSEGRGDNSRIITYSYNVNFNADL